MITLASTSALLLLETSAAGAVKVHASIADWTSPTAVAVDGVNTPSITSATTTTIVGSPGSGVRRGVTSLTAMNTHASVSNTVTLIHNDGTNTNELLQATLLPGWSLQIHDRGNPAVLDGAGRIVQTISLTNAPTVNELNIVVLASDVTNNNGVANTMQDVTGLSFAVVAGQTYWFRAHCDYTAAATATGSRWSINGPGSPTRLSYRSTYSLGIASETINSGLTGYDQPAASNATSAATAGNTAIIEGFITPSSDGTVIVRHASEVLSSAIVAKAGSILQWMRVR
jgi:hypothetical protein